MNISMKSARIFVTIFLVTFILAFTPATSHAAGRHTITKWMCTAPYYRYSVSKPYILNTIFRYQMKVEGTLAKGDTYCLWAMTDVSGNQWFIANPDARTQVTEYSVTEY